jgi:three-Cys-motif partner protein
MARDLQTFGGKWSDLKLTALSRYLIGFNTALKNTNLTRYYIDTFAGSGGHYTSEDSQSGGTLLGELLDEEPRRFLEGSALRALDTEPPFHKYIFSDVQKRNTAKLEKLGSRYPKKDIEVRQGDVNTVTLDIIESINWNKSRAVLFLDPFGAQVNWSTLEFVRKTGAVDVWYLVPTGLCMLRMIPHSGQVPEKWEKRITSMVGTDTWKEAFLIPSTQSTLFDTESQGVTRSANIEAVERFFLDRLKSLSANVVERCLRLNSASNSPLYSLCFFASNQGKGGKLAKRIADGVIKESQRTR